VGVVDWFEERGLGRGTVSKENLQNRAQDASGRSMPHPEVALVLPINPQKRKEYDLNLD
jgi:hypothetical protein